MKYLILLLLLVGCAGKDIRVDTLYDEEANTITEICVASSWFIWYDTDTEDISACGATHSTKGGASNTDLLQLLLKISGP